MKRVVLFMFAAAVLAACGQQAEQQANQEPYSAPSSADATRQAGYATDPGYTNQQDSGAEGGRGSAATGASDPGQAGDANNQQQPRPEFAEEQPQTKSTP
jgi:hypothetical protein